MRRNLPKTFEEYLTTPSQAYATQCTVVNHSNRKGEINYFVPYEGLNWF